MAFRVARMARVKSGAFKARKGIPNDVRDAYQALYGKRWEELFRAPAGCPPPRAKVLHSEWEGEIDSRIEALRAKQRGEGHDLTQREAQALAGVWYQWFISPHEENPGDPNRWAQRIERLTDAIYDATPWWDDKDPEFLNRDRAKEPEVRKAVHPLLADKAETAQFLASKGEVLTPAAMELFLDCLLDEFLSACELLQRRAEGDYTTDTNPQRFPEYRKARPLAKGSAKTCFELFRAYVEAVKPAVSTVTRWRVVFITLDKHLSGRGGAGSSIDDFSAEEAQRWASSLITPNRKARTVKETWVSASNTVFAWALGQKLITANPFADVPIQVPRRVRTREDGKAFSPSEQQVILKAALAITDTTSPFKAAYRWAPWLCAYSGARAGEITQLRGRDIEQRAGNASGSSYVVMKITPDAGAVKGSMPRTVPIHEHVIEQGFLEYVKSKGKGPLFYNPAPDTSEADNTLSARQPPDATNPKRPRYVMTRERLAAWVRGLGVTDTEIQPNHAWRHTFKQMAARVKIEKVMRDAICGHSSQTVGDEYEKPLVEDMAEALKQFPRYKID
jgi:integrase